MLTRLLVVIILKYIQILNVDIVHLKLMLHISYTLNEKNEKVKRLPGSY